MKKQTKAVAIALCAMLVIGAIPHTAYAAAKGTVQSVAIRNVTTKKLVLKPRQTFTLKAVVTVTGNVSKKVAYSSEKPKVASISKNGKITALKAGTTKITVKSKADPKKKASFELIVGTPVQKVTLSEKSASAKVGDSITLKATVSPAKASVKKVSFSSSDEGVATVSASGKVSCLDEGTATITATAGDGSGKKASCTVTVASNIVQGDDLSLDGYSLKWEDNFDGSELNRDDWNVELHEPGWVNEEWQEYVDSDKNIQVKNGKLFLCPVKTVAEDGTATYTSGRVNTQGKHDFTYGLFEARLKVPTGMGYLPAFWMMPTNESLYGQWPKCGEIDIMEVMGQDPTKLYGTVHYGEPHAQSQGTSVLESGNFSDEYHTFACEWEPGSLKWYVDGYLYHEEHSWHSTTTGVGTPTYPAPFDQPFYMILNLAIGGSWVGYPDESTSFDNEAFVIDYVRAYQKDSYDENVKKPEKDVVLRDPDENGNYVNNGDFSTDEPLDDGKDWEFMTTMNGEATASIADGVMTVSTTSEGDVPYSVQLVQAGIPLQKGATYELSFDAKADAPRTIVAGVNGPDLNYSPYADDETFELTTEYQTLTKSFEMKSDSDANARLDFNLGHAGSTDTIYLKNVSIKKTAEPDPNKEEEKTILADGNYVYNGKFQEGEGRLGFWEIENPANADISVTDLSDGRRLKVTSGDDSNADGVVLAQSDLAIVPGMAYALTFRAQADRARTIEVEVCGQKETIDVTEEDATKTIKIPADAAFSDKDISFSLGGGGTVWLDDVRLAEDAMIKNGSFNAGLSGYEPFVDSSSKAEFVVDSLVEDNALMCTIDDTGDDEWKIQLKQNDVTLEQGQWYKLSLRIKSTLDRKVHIFMQGMEDKGYPDYSKGDLFAVTGEYQEFSNTFQMTAETDPRAYLSICLGAVDGEQITTHHTVCIDDIVLEPVDAPE